MVAGGITLVGLNQGNDVRDVQLLSGAAFRHWDADCSGNTTTTCVLTMNRPHNVAVTFSNN